MERIDAAIESLSTEAGKTLRCWPSVYSDSRDFEKYMAGTGTTHRDSEHCASSWPCLKKRQVRGLYGDGTRAQQPGIRHILEMAMNFNVGTTEFRLHIANEPIYGEGGKELVGSAHYVQSGRSLFPLSSRQMIAWMCCCMS